MKERITTVDNESRFNPNDHMRVFERRQRQPDGSYKTVRVDYLDVKWRIVWFRQEHPNGSIVTELLSVPGEHPAVVRATVSYWDDAGTQVVGTGFGQQGPDDWSDWLEKAETRAIGRALGVLGYGTQFASDEFDDVVADAPQERPVTRQQTAPKQRPAQPKPAGQPAREETGELATERQVKAIFAIGKQIGFGGNEELIRYGCDLNDIDPSSGRVIERLEDFTKAEASVIIQALQEFK